MQLVNRWYEVRRISMVNHSTNHLVWRYSEDGRAVLVSNRTLWNRLALVLWKLWRRRYR
jgi:hypothetical protein